MMSVTLVSLCCCGDDHLDDGINMVLITFSYFKPTPACIPHRMCALFPHGELANTPHVFLKQDTGELDPQTHGEPFCRYPYRLDCLEPDETGELNEQVGLT